MIRDQMTRRTFLKIGGAVIVGLRLGPMGERRASAQTTPSADSFLGKTVSVQDSSGQTATGTVTAVQYQGSAPSVVVNGQSYDLSQVTSVSQAQAQTPSN